MSRVAQYSFQGGIFSPEMLGNRNLDQYPTGLQRCRNTITKPGGPLQNREGGEVVGWENHNLVGDLLEITATDNATPGLFTTARNPHPLVVGDRILCNVFDNSPTINGTELVVDTVPNPNEFTLVDDAGVDVGAIGISTYGMVQRVDPTNAVRCTTFRVSDGPDYALYFGNNWMMPVRSGGHELDDRAFLAADRIQLRRMTKTKPITVEFFNGPWKDIMPGDEVVIGEIDTASSTNNWGARLSGNRYRISFIPLDATIAVASTAMESGVGTPSLMEINTAVPHGLAFNAERWVYVEGVTGDMGTKINEKWWLFHAHASINTRGHLFSSSETDDSRLAGSYDFETNPLTFGFDTGAGGTLRFSDATNYNLDETDATAYLGIYPFDDPSETYSDCFRVAKIPTPFASSDLADLRFSQDGDVLSITDGRNVQRNLTRVVRSSPSRSAVDWDLELEEFLPSIGAPGLDNALLVFGENARRIAVTQVSGETGDESAPDWNPMPANAAKVIEVGGGTFGEEVFEWNVYSSEADTARLGFLLSSAGSRVTLDLVNVVPDFTNPPSVPLNPFETRGPEYDITAVTIATTLFPGQHPMVTVGAGDPGFFKKRTRVFIESCAGSEILNNRHFLADAEWDGIVPLANDVVTRNDISLFHESEDGIGAYTGNGKLRVMIQTLFPSAVGHFGQRRVFSLGSRVYACKSGSPSSFQKHKTVRATDAFEFDIANADSAIRHLVGVKHLLAFTGTAIYVISDDDAGGELTPAGVRVAGDYRGSISPVTPLLIGVRVLFYTQTGPTLRDLAFDGLTEQYAGANLSLMAPHLFAGYTILDTGYTAEPDPIVWSVRSDGAMLGLTYESDNTVRGWHQHDTPHGLYESTCSAREGAEDAAYDVVNRKLPVHRRRRYFERRRSRELLGDIRKAFVVDCGVRHENAFESGEVFAETPLRMLRPVPFVADYVAGNSVDVVHWIRKDGERVPGPHHKKRYEIKSVVGGSVKLREVGAGADIDGTDVLNNEVLEFGLYFAQTSVSRGLQHLIGETVDVFANGIVYKARTVNAIGQLSLGGALPRVSQWSIGFSYECDFQTLPPESGDPDVGSLIGQDIAMKRPILLMHDTTKGKIGGAVEKLRQLAQETDAVFENELKLFSEAKELDMGATRGDGSFFYRQDEPTPFMILAAVSLYD